MSQIEQPYTVEPFDPETDDPDEWLDEHREMLEFEAESDGPHAWVFQRLLDSIDDADSSGRETSGGASS